MASTTAANESPSPTRSCVFPDGKICGSERMDDLFNTRPVEWDLVVSITEVSERELIMATLIRLEGDFATRPSKGLE